MDELILKQTEDRLNALGRVLPAHGRVLILPHDYPDPDAFASAAALHLLLRVRFNVQGQIVFSGQVTRAENRQMLRQSRYAWHLLSEIRPSQKTIPCLIVDAHPSAANVTIPSFGRPVGVFDHHPPPRTKRENAIPFQDIRGETGATATILYEYLRVAKITIPPWLASLMVYAIATETLDLSRNWTPEDRAAYVDLVSQANMSLVGRIRHTALPRSYYVQLQDALRNTFIYGRVAWSHIENVRAPEIVPEVADFLCRMERVTWSFCTGYHRDELFVSLRSSLPTARCGALTRRITSAWGGAGGGHDWMAAGVIPLRGLDESGREALREQLVQRLLQQIEKRRVDRETLMDLARCLVPAEQKNATRLKADHGEGCHDIA